jgi:ribosomal-protein-alanine N-acetyltransferase
MKIDIRWMIRCDMPKVLAIESESFEFPWDQDNFFRCLRQRNCIGMVAVVGKDTKQERVVGFMVYELHKARLHVLNFCVAKVERRNGVGRQMVDKLVGKLSTQRRSRIVLEVRETNLDAQLFFREQGFRAVSILRGYYADTTEDAWMFQYRYKGRDACETKEQLSRLSGVPR